LQNINSAGPNGTASTLFNPAALQNGQRGEIINNPHKALEEDRTLDLPLTSAKVKISIFV
jgi:hypothetical protein